MILPNVVKQRNNEKNITLANASVQLIRKKKKNQKVLDPIKKMVIINLLEKKDQCNKMRYYSVPKQRKETSVKKRLVKNRKRLISGINTLALNGINHRRSRIGKLSKHRNHTQDDSDLENKNRTATVFPTLQNKQIVLPNFGKLIFLK